MNTKENTTTLDAETTNAQQREREREHEVHKIPSGDKLVKFLSLFKWKEKNKPKLITWTSLARSTVPIAGYLCYSRNPNSCSYCNWWALDPTGDLTEIHMKRSPLTLGEFKSLST